MNRRSFRIIVAAVAACMPLLAADGATLTFTKNFPGSNPPYVEVNVQKSGAAEYKEDPKDENPLKFDLSAEDTEFLFRLADSMGHFSHPVESGLKVANMGAKTFRYTSSTETHEVKFNYSEDQDAKSLLDWFERISETERNLIELERAVKFDKLGVQNAILQIEVSRDQKRLVAPKQFLPMLDRVAKNETYLHIARVRAASLADTIRAEAVSNGAAKPKAQ